MMKKSFLLVVITIMSACSNKTEEIRPAYTSPLHYQNYSCAQINDEVSRIVTRLGEISDIQDNSAQWDSAAMGLAVIAFTPGLLLISKADHHEEIKKLKGKFEALEIASLKKKCINSSTL